VTYNFIIFELSFYGMSCVETYVKKIGARMPCMVHNPENQGLTTDRRAIFRCPFHRTKTLAAVSKGANLSLSAVSFSKGTSTASVCCKVINEFAC
jgi:hypothetical protein